jgi:hypothetical protein
VRNQEYEQIFKAAITIESRTNLLFSFEKMAIRDAVGSRAGARRFAVGLCFLYGDQPLDQRFQIWVEAIDRLPHRQSRVLTWPVTTVFGYLAPSTQFFFKPTVTRQAARRLGIDLPYSSKLSWPVYKALLSFVKSVRCEIILHPRDMIDLQSFLWVQGSDEYPD